MQVGTTFYCVDIVDIRVQVFLVLVIVFQSNLNRNVVSLARNVNRIRNEFLAVGIEISDEVNKTILRIESTLPPTAALPSTVPTTSR